MAPRIFVFVLILIGVTILCGVGSADHIYTQDFAVHIRGGRSVADRLAEKYGYTNNGQIGDFEDHYLFTHHKVSKRSANPSTGSHTSLENEPEVHWMEQQVVRKRDKRFADSRADSNFQMFSDESWRSQWYMGADSLMNIQKAWKLGYTGKGVVVTILDDGLEYTHSDIAANYDPYASYDFNSVDNDPMPRYTTGWQSESNTHGTRCAGEVVMQANNGKCGVGVAHNASIGGIRMLDGEVTDYLEGQSLSFNRSHIDIYSVSWGPEDNGRTVDGPGKLAREAFYKGATKGRGGRGSIFVWASGNGGHANDHCGCDGYVNSIYTISIGSATEHQGKPWYSEECASILASTFSSGNKTEQKVFTTDVHDKCYGDFTGTSASTPMAAGIYALVLEAKPTLTWRDMQYLTVVTSKRHQLGGQWTTNGAGYDVSHIYGFGLMDAGAMVEKAVTWESLPDQHTCKVTSDLDGNRLRFTDRKSITIRTDSCADDSPVNYLEHVQLSLSLSVTRRGNVVIQLTSPSGTTCTLLGRRQYDNSREDFAGWTFMSTHFWGENPTGDWTLTIEGASYYKPMLVRKATLILWGTETLPSSLESSSRDSRASRVSRAIEDSSWWDSSWWWSSSEGESFDTCHIECLYGCDGPTAKDCYKCRHYKDRNTTACVAECPEGQFTPPELHVRCGRCSGSCKACTGSKKTDCLSCREGQYLTDTNQCSSSCGSGYYADQYFRMCRQCNPLCTKCSSNANQCTACVPGAVLRGTQCMLTCMESEYMEGQTCRPCHYSCYQCDGPADTDCTACYNDRVHKDMRCVTPNSCGQGYYLQDSFDAVGRQCLRCHATCLDCQGPGFTDCVACRQGSFLVGGACLQTCENGKFLDTDGACKWCDDGCAICADRDHCIQCEAQMVLTEEDNKLVCREGCEEGFYSMEGECFECHPTCTACNGGGIMDCTKCTQTGEGHKYLLEGACVSFCPRGFFELEYDGDFVCEECDESCSHCSGPSTDECTECESGLSLENGQCVETHTIACEVDNCDDCIQGNANVCQSCSRSYFLDGTQCVRNCPAGSYPVSDDGTCRLCHPSCKTCEGTSDHCTSCDPAYYLDTVDFMCLTQCPDDTYIDDVNKECVLCHDSCATCSGGGANECTSCYGVADFLSGSSCVQHCPNGLYGDVYTGTCRDCHPSCVTCGGPGDHECDSCHPHFNLGNDGACHSTCADKQYKDDSGCHSCHDTCETCTGPEPTQCLSCTYYLFLSSGQCLTDCEDRFYPDYESNVCRPCHPSCKTCLEAGEEDCIECSDNTYMLLKNGQLCVEVCPEGYYNSTELGFRDCRQCSIECRDCHSTYLNCISCRDETYLYQGRCFSTCPSGYYEDQTTNHCLQQRNLCPLYCDECDDWGDCTVCNDGYVEYFGECVAEDTLACPKNQFIESYNSEGSAVCRDCHESCSTCLGPTENDCVSCHERAHFQGSRCVSDCAEDQYLDKILKACFACHPTCASCDSGSPSDCTSCPHEMTLSGPGNHGECRFGCGEGQYLDNNGECQNCADTSSCTLCSGPELNQCLTCKLGYFKSVDGGCTNSCKVGTYAYPTEGTTEGSECRSCHASCQSCVGPAMDQCRSCEENMVYMNGLCLWDCDSGYYPDEYNVCRECNRDCQTCSGPTALNCTSCRINKWLQVSECVDNCESDWFQMTDDTPRCLECDPSCLTCTDYGPFDCTTCHAHHQLVDGVCYNRCGQQRFFDRKPGVQTCVTCHESCHNCFGPGPDQCIDCAPGQRLERVDRNHSKCIPCCDGAQDGVECCDTCKPDYVKCLKSYVRNQPPTSGPKVSVHHVGTIVFAVIMVVLVFFLVFGLLQARSHGKLCWARKYAKVPSYYNTKDKYVTLGKPDDDYYEEDIYGDVSEEEDDDADEIDHLQTGVHRTVDRNGIIDHL